MTGGRPRTTGSPALGVLAREGVWEAFIAFVATALFAGTVGAGWVYDDQMEIVLNPFIRSLSNLPQIFSTTAWAGSGMETYLYRPLALVTYALNHAVSGLAPWSYHLVNVLLHAGASVLVFRLGRRWGLSVVAAGVGGLIFAAHPVHVEVVAAVFGRKDLLAGLFTLAMVLLHNPAVTRGGWRMGLPVAAFAGAMLSKEVGVAAIGLVAAQDWFLTADRSRLARDGRRAGLYVGYAAVLLAYVLVRNRVTGGVGVPDTFYMDNPLVSAPLGVRLATALVVVGKGLALQAIPHGLSPDYSFNAIPLVGSATDWRLLGTLAAAAALGWGLLRSRAGVEPGAGEGDGGGPNTRPPGSLGGLRLLPLATAWYLVSLLPSANVLVTVGTIFGERLLYLPSVAFCLLVGSFFGWLLQGVPDSEAGRAPQAGKDRGAGRLGAAGALLWIGFLAIQTVSYAGVWENDLSLFRHAVKSVPASTKANHKLGEELLRAGEPGPAIPFLRRALEIAPDNEFAALTLGEAGRALGGLYLPPRAPGVPPPPPLPADPEILWLLGQMSREGGDLAGAETLWTEALAADSAHAPTHAALGGLRLATGDTAGAIAHLEAAVRLNPKMAPAWLSLGRVHLAKGNHRDAQRALESFIEAAGSRFPAEVQRAREALLGLPHGPGPPPLP